MTKIDDEPGQIIDHVPEPNPFLELLALGSEKASALVPQYGFLFSFIIALLRSRAPKNLTITERQILESCQNLHVRIDTISKRIQSDERLQLLGAQIAERIRWGATESKTKRFAAVFASTAATAETDREFENAASFIRAIAELTEEDISVLKHLYSHQSDLVREDLAMDTNSFFHGGRMIRMLRDVGHLSMKRDDITSSMQRLTGYGLAIPLERRPAEMMIDEHAFRMTLMGKRLSDLLLTNE